MPRTIQYAIHDDGHVISRVGSEVAWPILDYDGMTPENSYAMIYNLETMSVHSVAHEWHMLKWTRKIPVEIKNIHREYWGFPKLKVERA